MVKQSLGVAAADPVTNTVLAQCALPICPLFSALCQETRETGNISLIWVHFIINSLLVGSATGIRQETIVSHCSLYGSSIAVPSIGPCNCAVNYADGPRFSPC